MIKLWADSLDKNFDEPNESFMFVKDLILYGDGFRQASSVSSCDVIVIPQYSNNYINNLIGNYEFDKAKADNIFTCGKPVVIVNTGGGCPCEWNKRPLKDYMYGQVSKKVIVFSTECYSWHREHFEKSAVYLPYDYVGFADFGLGLRKVPPIQSMDNYLQRKFGTSVIMNVYPPTRDRIYSLVHEQDKWEHFTYVTTANNQTRIDWGIMASRLYNSKIGFAPDGATGKTERHLFTPSYTAMAIQEIGLLEFPYKWIDGVNCIEMVHDFQEGLEREKEISYQQNGHHLRVLNKEKTKEKIINWLSKPKELYDIYVNGWHNDSNYRLPNYVRNYVGEKIKENI